MSPELFILMLTQQAAAPTGPARAFNVWEMVLKAGPMVQFVMMVLLLFSIVSWAIIIFKSSQLGKARRHSYYFLDLFWKSRSLANIYAESDDYESSPVAQIFRVGYQELGRMRKAKADIRQGMENVQRALRRATASESTRLLRTLSFLATTGNAAPFIGLFGTVWGIMGSFHEIGQAGTASLATVAPGISEALVATAAGLAAAIPAVVAFNHFNSRVRVLEAEMMNFVSDFLNIIERDMIKKTSSPSKEDEGGF
ncbi:MAG: protein TolQ [Thermodesulfobacteriota bacterium]